MLVFYLSDYAQVVLPIDSAQFTIECPDEAEFSWQGCDCCADDRIGKYRLGGDVYACKVWPAPGSDFARLSARDLGEYWDKHLCAKCVYEHHYGKGSYEA